MKRLAALAVPCLLLACNQPSIGAQAPWLTAPDLTLHSTRYFPIAPGATHGAAAGQPLTTCNQCHADRSTGAPPYPPSTSFKTFTCTGCHVEIRPGIFHDDVAGLATIAPHANQPGFDPAQPLAFDQACLRCHPTGVGIDHARVFPLPHQDAAGTVVAACSDCHVAPADRTVLGCAACHPHDQPATATAHAAVPDFDASTTAAASALCARCHGDSTVPIRVTAHAAFPIGTGKTHAGAAGGACLSCHPATLAAPKAFAADFAQPSCTGCHVQTAAGYHDDGAALATYHTAQGVTGFAFTTSDCLRCHPDGAGGAPPYHGQLFPIDSASKHAGIGCSSCHGPTRADVTQLQCASCHADSTRTTPALHAPSGVAVLVAAMPNPPPASCTPPPLGTVHSPIAASDDPRACLQCHALSAPVPVSAHPGGNSAFGTGRHEGAGCLTCHTTTVTITAPVTPAPAGYPAIDFSQPANPSRTSTPGCTTCHQSATCGNN